MAFEIGLVWIVGIIVFFGTRKRADQVAASSIEGRDESEKSRYPAAGSSAGSRNPQQPKQPPEPPTYERLTRAEKDAAILALKKAMDSGHLQLEPAASPEPEEPKTMRRRDQWMDAIPDSEMNAARELLRRTDELRSNRIRSDQNPTPSAEEEPTGVAEIADVDKADSGKNLRKVLNFAYALYDCLWEPITPAGRLWMATVAIVKLVLMLLFKATQLIVAIALFFFLFSILNSLLNLVGLGVVPYD